MLIPHLHFAGDCREAITLYERAFGTEVELIILNSDYDAALDGVAHAAMRIHGQTVYLNDRFGNRGRGRDTAVHIILTFKTTDELLACYEILKPGSTTIDPLAELPYSPLAVQFIDRFGVQWGFMADKG